MRVKIQNLPTIQQCCLCVVVMMMVANVCGAQTNVIYADSLASGWSDSSYGITKNYANTSPVHSGSDSIAVTITSAYGGIGLYHAPMTNSAYAAISFWINGGVSGGQQLQMYGTLGAGATPQSARYQLNIPLANSWQQCVVPFSDLGVANATNFSGFVIQDSAGSTEPEFYIDDIQLISATSPAVVHLSANASSPVRIADARWYGMNVAQWDSALDSSTTVNQLTNMGARALRFPGGSNSDDYRWAENRQTEDTWQWASSVANFIHMATNANCAAMTTVNYGTGYTNEAAAWVAYANAPTTSTVSLGTDSRGTNWFTAGYWASLRAATPLGTDDGKNFLRIGRSAPLGLKYWEIGNELYGSWETDSNAVPHDPYTYAVRAKNYIALMKAVDPTIKVGVVVVTGEDAYANNTSHPAVNPRTGVTHYGWTPVLLTTLKSQGATPDFLIYHNYPQGPGGENDASLLQSASAWASEAANLRQQLTDYIGTGGTNIELVCTENNSVSSSPGKQSTSLVNGLYYADSLAQLMQTEFNGLFWWNFRNGGVETNNTSSSLYGWRIYGDYGVTEGTDYYPPYYTARLMQNFIQPGDTVISAGSDYSLLAAYAARRQDGALTLLAINKDPVNTFTGLVAVAGFTPATNATVYSYGIPQDDAAETGIGSPDVARTNFIGAATNFSYSFPPYSATVLLLAPAPAKLSALPLAKNAAQFVFQVQGQGGVPYVVQYSTNLVNWISASTNTASGGLLNITNAVAPAQPRQFWRVVWEP
ncbi:MAG TPA: hypothetical protein VK742_15695 [Candidatus Sulfotelmatobacter sp.]|jgi:alpha-N-arabinofuranosidase|nr:hypothetical protein [Candidatus Sulfotelmatobacter sp.]